MRHRTNQTLPNQSRLTDLRQLPHTSFLLKPALSKRCTRAARGPSPFYDSSWLTNIDKFPAAVSRFNEILADFQVIDSSLQQFITTAVVSAVVTAIASIQTNHESKMLSLREMIEKSLLLRNSPSTTLTPDPDTALKVYPGANPLPKSTTKRWNQADLGYFDPYLNRAHRGGKIVSIGKDVYYRNVVLFVQRLQSLVTF